MLAVVKKPHIELSISGENIDNFIGYLKKKYEIEIVSSSEDELINIRDSEFWKEMNKNRKGNLLAGARHRTALTQKQLAEKIGISQNMISDYEKGKRNIGTSVASKLSKVLELNIKHIK